MKPTWIDRTDMEEEPEAPEDVVQAEPPVEQEKSNTAETTGIILGLAALPEKAILTEAALAAAIGVTQRTIRRMVQRNEIPPPVPLAGQAVWFSGNVLSHIQSRMERRSRDVIRQQNARERLLSA
jgi:predicted DNA-binding transcriptional regulator AlpA